MRSLSFSLLGCISVSFAAIAFAVSATPVWADPVITNGIFASSSSGQFGTEQPGLITLAGWTTSGYNFVFQPGVADTTGAEGEFGNVTLFSPADSSPVGGNFVGMDADFHTAGISTTVTGLTPGVEVTIGFYYAAAQQTGFLYGSDQGFDVTLGTQTDITPTLTIAQGGFSGWSYDTLSFDPTAASEVLSFATDSPSGQPPFTLLADVTISNNAIPTVSAPEPDSLVLLATGLLGLGGFLRYRHQSRREG